MASVMVSSMDWIDEMPAKTTAKNNIIPYSLPRGISLKAWGKTTKSNFGPLAVENPKAKQAGSITKAEIIAASVSRPVVMVDALMTSSSSGKYEP